MCGAPTRFRGPIAAAFTQKPSTTMDRTESKTAIAPQNQTKKGTARIVYTLTDEAPMLARSLRHETRLVVDLLPSPKHERLLGEIPLPHKWCSKSVYKGFFEPLLAPIEF